MSDEVKDIKESGDTSQSVSKRLTPTKLQATKTESGQGWECSITGYITVEDVDRDGDLILVDGIEYETYLKNPVVLWHHEREIPSVGRCVWIKPTTYEGKKALLSKMVFGGGEFAQELYAAYEEGSLSAFSIGFDTSTNYIRKPTDEEKAHYPNCLSVIEKCSLNEFSCVNVPANFSALVERKQKGLMSSAFEKVLNLPTPEITPIAVEVPSAPIEPAQKQIQIPPPTKKTKLVKRKSQSAEVLYLTELEKLDSKTIMQKAISNLKNRYRA